MQHFCDPLVCYLGFLAAISNMQIVDWIWFCPDRLSVTRLVLMSKQILCARLSTKEVVVLKIILTFLL